jgi:hypothetical protein
LLRPLFFGFVENVGVPAELADHNAGREFHRPGRQDARDGLGIGERRRQRAAADRRLRACAGGEREKARNRQRRTAHSVDSTYPHR